MKHLLPLLTALVLFISCRQPATDGPTRIIFDTDMGNDIDDAEALALLHSYIDDRQIDLLGICLNKEGELTTRFIDIMNTFYGHTDIPLGRARNNGGDGTDPANAYTGKVCALTAADGTPLFPTTGIDHDALPDGHILYRQLLAAQPDHSVTVVSVGFLTNLARLLDTPADHYSPLTGKELVARKVKCLSIMAGRFRDEVPEYNVAINIPAARKIFDEWPTPIVSMPWELGEQVRYPVESMENDYSWTPAHPLREAYIRYQAMPYSNWMFDPTAVIYAVEGETLYTSSGPGTITVDEAGVTRFTPDPNGRHSYTTLTPGQAQALIDYSVARLTRQTKTLDTAE